MSTTRIKICGITRPEDARAVQESGCDAIGIVFWPGSPRYLTDERAREIVASIDRAVLKVGVFVDASVDDVKRAVEHIGITAAQLCGSLPHGDWTQLGRSVRLIRAVGVGGTTAHPTRPVVGIDDYLLDHTVGTRFGGTGTTFDWKLAKPFRTWGRIWLAGGLNPENVGVAVRTLRPYAVDVSSGVETTPGIKSAELITQFVASVREADRDEQNDSMP